MEMVNDFEQKSLLIELTRGKEMANQLKNQLDHGAMTTVSPEASCELLVEEILSTYDKALAMLTWKAFKQEDEVLAGTGGFSQVSGSPLSKASSGACKDRICRKDVSKKRKLSSAWSEQVRVRSKVGHEGPSLDDGHSWRKYGQKDIFGTRHPRAYYRCTHRNSRGCLATKQVQRTDEDPSIFEVTYNGKHTCMQTPNSGSIFFSHGNEISNPEKPESKAKDEKQMLLNLGNGLTVETEFLNQENCPPVAAFPFGGDYEYENQEIHFFCEAMKEIDRMESCSPSFLSPTSSDSNYCSSPCQVNSFGTHNNVLKSSKYDHFADIISPPTSVVNSPFDYLDFSIDQEGFDPNPPLDPLSYLS